MARKLALTVKLDELDDLAADLGRLSDTTLGEAIVRGVNDTADWADEESHKRMSAGLAIDEADMRARREVKRATARNLTAIVQTVGSATSLGRFGAAPHIVAAKSPPARLKGNPRIGIPRGGKQGGVLVSVSKGSRKIIKDENVFLNTGLSDSSGNPLVMRRLGGTTKSGKAKLEALFGPSPYQLFAHQLKSSLAYEAEEQLSENLVTGVGDAFEKALRK